MDWSLCAWCGKDFERREAPLAAMAAVPASRETTGQIESPGAPATVPTVTPSAASTKSSVSSAKATETQAPHRSSVRSSGPARPATGPLPMTPQDPLPER